MHSATLTRARRGQGVTEYVVIVGLCALLLVSAVQALRSSVSNAYNTATLKVASASNDPNDPAFFHVSAGNPYRYNRRGVWRNSDGTFVPDHVVRPFEPDPSVWADARARRHTDR